MKTTCEKVSTGIQSDLGKQKLSYCTKGLCSDFFREKTSFFNIEEN